MSMKKSGLEVSSSHWTFRVSGSENAALALYVSENDVELEPIPDDHKKSKLRLMSTPMAFIPTFGFRFLRHHSFFVCTNTRPSGFTQGKTKISMLSTMSRT